MMQIKKVTPDEEPQVCIPDFGCVPSTVCIPTTVCIPIFQPVQSVSGTYRSPKPSGIGSILELRVDVDGRRPQARVSGDLFFRSVWGGFSWTFYQYSFVVESLSITHTGGEMVITGPVIYYHNASLVNDTIEIRIPRVSLFASPADATVKLYRLGSLLSTSLCPKTSESFRVVNLEIDRLLGTTFPPSADTHTEPHPADLPKEDLTCAEIFRRAGIDMTVVEDDVLNVSDSSDPGTTWDWGELHDLMEDHFTHFANIWQWNVYGVIVPEFEAPGVAGIMFDWGGGQPGDTHFRQGAAVAYDKIYGSTPAKKDRVFLHTFVHEIGHAFNLPHTWLRSMNPDSASESFMNYPSLYSGGSGGTAAYWSNFRWEFDDVELAWMRHADRKDVIFGGEDWVWNNLSILMNPEMDMQGAPFSLEIRSSDIYELGQPVRVELKLKNVSGVPQAVAPYLRPEDELVVFYLQRPNGEIVSYAPPIRQLRELKMVELAPGESLYESVLLSYGAKGPQFQQPGEYILRAYYQVPNAFAIVSPSCRLRIASPHARSTEELAHTLFGHEAAKFIYFGGTERHPELIARLHEMAERYVKTDPAIAREVEASLGLYYSRPFKQVIAKGDKRVVTCREANLHEAEVHLEAARAALPDSQKSALDNITYNKLSMTLADCYQKEGDIKEAERVLRGSLEYFERRKVVKSVLDDYSRRLSLLSEQR